MSERIKKLAASMTDEELCSEVLLWEFSEKLGKRALEKFIKENSVANFYYSGEYNPEYGGWIAETVKKHSEKTPLVVSDESNVLKAVLGESLPSLMSFGASGDTDAIHRLGVLLGRACRSVGVHMTFSPSADVNYNFNNPSTNVRTVSDDPERVYKITASYAGGMGFEGNAAACIKHFPGDGTDDRNRHFSTTENMMSMNEWRESFGKIYKKMISDGIGAIMVGHTALPAFGVERDELGAYPSTISYRIITDLLKGELGFSGCVVSDAMSMIGVASRVPADRIAVEFFRAGGDLLQYPERGDYQRLLLAVKQGEISKERIRDAACRTLLLKERLGLLDAPRDEKYVFSAEDAEEIRTILKTITEGSITLLRNLDKTLPLRLGKAPRILQINISYSKKNERANTIPNLTMALEEEGCTVDFMTNPTHYRVDNMIDGYDAVIIACDISPMNCSGSSLRVDWNNIMAFWRGYALRNKRVVFLSLGDPYKLYDLPFLRTYVNAYSTSESSVRAAVKAIFGKIPFKGKSPVSLAGCFEREDL